jgi:prevent-host-death family protein
MHWQVQEAKQRFSEVLRAVADSGPQFITRHGQEIAVIIDTSSYHQLTEPSKSVVDVLLGPPHLDDTAADVLAEVEAERKHDLPPEPSFGDTA